MVLLRAENQEVAIDPSGWERRILSPVLPNVEFEFMRTTLHPGVNAGAFLPHNPGSREYVAVERGTLRLTLDGKVYVLKKGESIYYAGDCVHEFENPDRRSACEYYLAMDVTGHPEQLRHRRATAAQTKSRGESHVRLSEEEFRKLGYQAVDMAASYLAELPGRPVFQRMQRE